MQSFALGGSNGIPVALFAEMYRKRKRVFVDLLGWNIPVHDDEFEFDQFDGPMTRYLMMLSPEGDHLGSLRMLSTDGPTLLGEIFPFLCDGPPPASPNCWEISRFCLSRKLRAADRRSVRHQLVTAAANFALDNGISAYVCIADMGWLKPYELQWLAYLPEVAKHFAPDLAALEGYRIYRPNLGNIEGRCPSRLLGDHADDRGAVDALGAQQSALIDQFRAGTLRSTQTVSALR